MFYCDECAVEKKYPKTYRKSQGKCEICGIVFICNDMPSAKLQEMKYYG